ncbi:hypothetical protein PVAP13_6NG051530 [Panicum virgatum]|uniref:F-box domain-containing protein n=1 Tax=Panicum virgatum TaxID=38727 RepID=A0A8T0QUM4_PANVG|nr:hypothetical protein PVAP13_6NG051530 [Panicum virgatum]
MVHGSDSAIRSLARILHRDLWREEKVDRRRRMSQGDDHRQILAPNGSIALANKPKGSSCQQDGDSCFLKENGDGDSQAGETITMRCSIPCLPEDIWHHVHSLMPLRDAARAACLSHAFLRSWRCYPNLIFDWVALRPETCTYPPDFGGAAVDSIMRNHSGIGVKILKLGPFFIAYHNLNSWLHVAVKPGIEELTLRLWDTFRKKYKFPGSLLLDGMCVLGGMSYRVLFPTLLL